MHMFAPRSNSSRIPARLAIAAGLLALLASLVFATLPSTGAAQQAAKPKPSFVVIQVDDATIDQLYATFSPGGIPIQAMPYTLSLIAGKGITFNRYYVPYPLCCPARVSLLTGRYAHNHNVKGNVPPNGGFTGFKARQAYSHNLAPWLQQAGYRTVHIGKFLNGYGDEPFDEGKDVPPGWSAWHSVLRADTHHYFYGYTLNNNGVLSDPIGDPGSWDTREYGERDDFGCPAAPLNGKPCLYQTDIFNRIAWEEISGTSPEQPFYLQVDYTSPHGDFRRPAGPEPATRHYNLFAGAPYPHGRSEGFNEGNVNDKPRFIREAPFLSFQEIRTYRVYYQKALESLRSVDEGVKLIHDTLGSLGRLRNTYIIFTSDNGFFFGEHRLTGGKFIAYEPATHLPLLMRGPGIAPGTATGELVSQVDIAPTILELAGASPDKSIDGRSLVPFMRDPALRTRRPLLFESFVETNDVEANGQPGAAPVEPEPGPAARPSTAKRNGASASIVAPPKDYVGIRLGPYKYIEWPSREKELYDINKDPHELNNLIRVRNLSPIRAFLHAQLVRLVDCKGRGCQEVAPKFPLTREQQRKVDKQRREEERRKEKEREQKRHPKREQRR
ncbi:MAG TPA: sulfatase [Solirubrobacterales bacterium]|nr:sulfatase [Solirubrobacterales bacterium]